MKIATLKNLMTGAEVRVHATTEHPDSSYGKAVWVDNEGVAYFQVGTQNPFYELHDLIDVNNYDVESKTFFGGVGYLKEVGDYPGEYMQQAKAVLDIDGELTGEAWCDICVANNGALYAVCGNTAAHNVGSFFFKKISNGIEADGELIELVGREIARYNVYYNGTDCVDYSIRFIKVGEYVYSYNTKDFGKAYISSSEQLEQAKEDASEEEGYWE